MWLQKPVFEKKFSLNISQTFLEARLALFDSCSNRLRFGEFPHETYKSVSNNNKIITKAFVTLIVVLKCCNRSF